MSIGLVFLLQARVLTSQSAEKCYVEPEKFIPERWYSRPELVKDARSFLPFAQGRYTCLGKGLALSELRIVTALLISKYRIGFVQGDDGAAVQEDLRDSFTACPGSLRLNFAPRK
jgi:cytochrome P450